MLLAVEMERKRWVHDKIFRIWRLPVRSGEKKEGSKMTPRLLVNISSVFSHLFGVYRKKTRFGEKGYGDQKVEAMSRLVVSQREVRQEYKNVYHLLKGDFYETSVIGLVEMEARL